MTTISIFKVIVLLRSGLPAALKGVSLFIEGGEKVTMETVAIL